MATLVIDGAQWGTQLTTPELVLVLRGLLRLSTTDPKAKVLRDALLASFRDFVKTSAELSAALAVMTAEHEGSPG